VATLRPPQSVPYLGRVLESRERVCGVPADTLCEREAILGSVGGECSAETCV